MERISKIVLLFGFRKCSIDFKTKCNCKLHVNVFFDLLYFSPLTFHCLVAGHLELMFFLYASKQATRFLSANVYSIRAKLRNYSVFFPARSVCVKRKSAFLVRTLKFCFSVKYFKNLRHIKLRKCLLFDSEVRSLSRYFTLITSGNQA